MLPDRANGDALELVNSKANAIVKKGLHVCKLLLPEKPKLSDKNRKMSYCKKLLNKLSNYSQKWHAIVQCVANFSTSASGACYATCNSFSVRWRPGRRWRSGLRSGISERRCSVSRAGLNDPSAVFLSDVHTMDLASEAPPCRLQHAHVFMNPSMHRASRNQIIRRARATQNIYWHHRPVIALNFLALDTQLSSKK